MGMPRLFDLTNKTALITGAGKGIGKAIAVTYAKFGADVLICSRTKSDLEKTAEKVRRQGRKAYCFVMDISNMEDVSRGAHKAIEMADKIDILVNNAGTNIPRKALEVTEQQWDIIQNTNVKGLFFFTQEIAKGMLERKKGKIVNIASNLGLVGSAERSAYVTSKGAVVLLTKALAAEWAPYNINVNAICPAMIKTTLVAQLTSQGYRTNMIKKIPMGRLGKVEDVVGAAVFLASEASNFVTGHALVVDGGYLAV
ncbi:MAG: glucose 1-dehydrogenase [Deltaproteobacteria bacterium]|nr:MAG: glucose 1-dehydrogenase [Deltaproteobacteria bacterium]